ncbi:hypothetical protein EV361DRAFT_497630 [Lentinula raphanica]|nr:hypothetical protein EV361DRAFT_497630 [Lentinula raphanica]
MRLFTFICSLVAVALLLASAADAVAENSMDACNCPNHCYYTEGHECKYQRSVAIEGLTMSGSNVSIECIRGTSMQGCQTGEEQKKKNGQSSSPGRKRYRFGLACVLYAVYKRVCTSLDIDIVNHFNPLRGDAKVTLDR